MFSKVFKSICHFAENEPNRLALTSDSRSLTYEDLACEIRHFSDTLLCYKGRCLALDMDNSPEWVIADLACIHAGIVALPLPPFFTDDQRDYACTESGAVGIIHHNLAISALNNAPVIFPKGTDKITFTSGTTSHPKGVCLSQAGMEQVAVSLLEVIGYHPAQKTVALLPLGVLLENIAGCYTTLLAGGCYDVRQQADIGLKPNTLPNFIILANYLAESAATSCIFVPELLRGVMMALAQTGLRLPSMQFMAVGGSKVSPELLVHAERLGLSVYQGYGLSECASVVAVNTPKHNHTQSVGKPLAHIHLHIAEDGEVLIEHPAFLGYLGSESAADLYPTGDLGHLDDRGYLHITGRKKNVLITAYGRNISPEWPESELLAQPEIAQCLVFGDTAPMLSALLVPSKADTAPSALKAAIAKANTHLPDYAQVKHWQVVKPFTSFEGLLTGTGRPKRQAILEAHRLWVETLNGEENYANVF